MSKKLIRERVAAKSQFTCYSGGRNRRHCVKPWVSTSPAGAINASSAAIARSYEDAYLAGASINNNSWGGPFYSDVLYRVMKEAQNYDMLFVCAAGNDAKDVTVSLNYPASMSQWLDNVIVVAVK